MDLKIIFFILIVVASVLEVIADLFLKKWSMNSRNVLFIIGVVIYFIATIFWAFSLKYELMSRAITVFFVLNMILVVLAGVLIFGEKISLINKLGILLGIISLVLVEI